MHCVQDASNWYHALRDMRCCKCVLLDVTVGVGVERTQKTA